MAWTTPRTWTTSELVTASIMNTHVRDNLNYLYTNAAFSLIQDEDKTSDGASFDFTSIAATYKHLRILATLRGTTSAATVVARLRFNNDSAGSYRDNNGAAQTQIAIQVEGDTGPAGAFSIYVADITNYADSAQWRAVSITSSNVGGGATTINTSVGFWTNTADAINRVTVLPDANNWLAGSRLTLYGLN